MSTIDHTEGLDDLSGFARLFVAKLSSQLQQLSHANRRRPAVVSAHVGWEHLRGALPVLSAADIDAAFLALRARLLWDLAGPAGTASFAAPELHGLGDHSPEGLMVAVEEAEVRAMWATPAAAPPTLRAATRLPDGETALRVLVHDKRATVNRLTAVSFCDEAAAFQISLPTGDGRTPCWDARGPAIGLVLARPGQEPSEEWKTVRLTAWRRAFACVVALYAIPGMGMPPKLAQWASRTVRATLVALFTGSGDQETIIADTVYALCALTGVGRGQVAFDPAQPVDALMRALDAMRGDGGEELPLPFAIGQRVALGDELEGYLLDPPAYPESAELDLHAGELPDRPHSDVHVWVVVGGRQQRLPVTALRRPSGRLRLFDAQ